MFSRIGANRRLETHSVSSFCVDYDMAEALPIGPIVVPFGGSYLKAYKVIPKKELLWGLWVDIQKSWASQG